MGYVHIKIYDDNWDVACEHKKLRIEEAIEKLTEYKFTQEGGV